MGNLCTRFMRMPTVQAAVAAHERVVRTILHSATPQRDHVRDAIAALVEHPTADGPGGALGKGGMRPQATAVDALQVKVALGVLAEAMMASDFQDASCMRYVPAAFGGTLPHPRFLLPSQSFLVVGC